MLIRRDTANYITEWATKLLEMDDSTRNAERDYAASPSRESLERLASAYTRGNRVDDLMRLLARHYQRAHQTFEEEEARASDPRIRPRPSHERWASAMRERERAVNQLREAAYRHDRLYRGAFHRYFSTEHASSPHQLIRQIVGALAPGHENHVGPAADGGLHVRLGFSLGPDTRGIPEAIRHHLGQDVVVNHAHEEFPNPSRMSWQDPPTATQTTLRVSNIPNELPRRSETQEEGIAARIGAAALGAVCAIGSPGCSATGHRTQSPGVSEPGSEARRIDDETTRNIEQMRRESGAIMQRVNRANKGLANIKSSLDKTAAQAGNMPRPLLPGEAEHPEISDQEFMNKVLQKEHTSLYDRVFCESDRDERELERRAISGDPEAAARLARARERSAYSATVNTLPQKGESSDDYHDRMYDHDHQFAHNIIQHLNFHPESEFGDHTHVVHAVRSARQRIKESARAHEIPISGSVSFQMLDPHLITGPQPSRDPDQLMRLVSSGYDTVPVLVGHYEGSNPHIIEGVDRLRAYRAAGRPIPTIVARLHDGQHGIIHYYGLGAVRPVGDEV